MFKKLILKIIRFYQAAVSPLLAKRCRFYPSCSAYAFLVIKKQGILKGGFQSLKRVLKCHPWNPGGVDLT